MEEEKVEIFEVIIMFKLKHNIVDSLTTKVI